MPKPLPGRYNINKVTLRNDNTFVDINKGIIREMNFYESIYSPTITGFLVLTETVNLTSSRIVSVLDKLLQIIYIAFLQWLAIASKSPWKLFSEVTV